MTAPLQSDIKPPRKRGRVPQRVREIAQEYKDAYAAVYGLRPTVSYEITTGWFTLHGAKERVKLKRLKEMTTQLRRRIG